MVNFNRWSKTTICDKFSPEELSGMDIHVYRETIPGRRIGTAQYAPPNHYSIFVERPRDTTTLVHELTHAVDHYNNIRKNERQIQYETKKRMRRN